MSYDLLFALVCSLAGILVGAVWIRSILARPAGNERMREIAAAVQQGAVAYLTRQYKAITIVGVVLFLLIGIGLGSWSTAIGFLMAYDNLEFPEAVEALAEMMGLDVPRETTGAPERKDDNEELYSLLREADQI